MQGVKFAVVFSMALLASGCAGPTPDTKLPNPDMRSAYDNTMDPDPVLSRPMHVDPMLKNGQWQDPIIGR